MFQYQLWPGSCSLRYITFSIFVMFLAMFWQIIIYNTIMNDSFEDIDSDPSTAVTIYMAQFWVCTITVGNILDVVFSKRTGRPIRLDYSLCVDLMLLLGTVL